MSPVPNVAIQVPIFWGDRVLENQQLLSFFQLADELGFHSLWVVDRLLHPNNAPHSLTILTYAAACTIRIGLGTAVFLLSLRNPVDVARQTATPGRTYRGAPHPRRLLGRVGKRVSRCERSRTAASRKAGGGYAARRPHRRWLDQGSIRQPRGVRGQLEDRSRGGPGGGPRSVDAHQS